MSVCTSRKKGSYFLPGVLQSFAEVITLFIIEIIKTEKCVEERCKKRNTVPDISSTLLENIFLKIGVLCHPQVSLP